MILIFLRAHLVYVTQLVCDIDTWQSDHHLKIGLDALRQNPYSTPSLEPSPDFVLSGLKTIIKSDQTVMGQIYHMTFSRSVSQPLTS